MAEKVPPILQFFYENGQEKVGLYSDAVRTAYSPYTFSFEFAQVLAPGSKPVGPNVLARVVMSPEHAKAFLGLLKNDIETYEEKYGTIKTFEKKPSE